MRSCLRNPSCADGTPCAQTTGAGAGARSRSGALSIAPAGESGAVALAILLANMSAGAGFMGEVALYHWEPNANSGKPMLTLMEKGVAFDSHYVDLLNFDQH